MIKNDNEILISEKYAEPTQFYKKLLEYILKLNTPGEKEEEEEETQEYDDKIEKFTSHCFVIKDMQDEYDTWSKMYPVDLDDEKEGYIQPTFEHMTVCQLRTYVAWRTHIAKIEDKDKAEPVDHPWWGHIERIRAKNEPRVSPEYVYLYVCEILANLDDKEPEAIMHDLVTLLKKARVYLTISHPSVDRATTYRNIIRSYYIIHHQELKESCDYYVSRANIYADGDIPNHERRRRGEVTIQKGRHKRQISQHIWDELETVELSSSYKITTSKFYEKIRGEDIERVAKCVSFVLKRLDKTFEKNNIDLKKLFYTQKLYDKTLFKNLVFNGYKDIHPDKTKVMLDEYTGAIKINGIWKTIEYVIDEKEYVIGYILKYIEKCIGKELKINGRIQHPKLDEVRYNFIETGDVIDPKDAPEWKRQIYKVLGAANFQDIIQKYVSLYYEIDHRTRFKELYEIKIDNKELKNVRADHEDTAEKLSVYENIEEERALISKPVKEEILPDKNEEEMGFTAFKTLLTEAEITILQELINGNSPKVSPLVIEMINEKSLTKIGDNILEMTGDSAELYEEYTKELKECLQYH